MAQISTKQSEINNSSNNKKAFVQVDSLCKYLFKDLLQRTFEGVGLENAKKMAPKNTNMQTAHVLRSFVNVAFTQKYKNVKKLVDQKDPAPASIDNLAVQEIDSQKVKPRHLTQIPQQSSTTKSRFKGRKAQNSVRSRKFTNIDQNGQQIKSKLLSNFQKLPQPKSQYDFSDDPQLNKVRNNYLKIQNQNNQRQQQIQRLKQKSLLQRQKSQKVAKQLKKITFDYEGKLFGQGNGMTQKQRLMNLENKFGNIKKTMLKQMNIEKTTIQIAKKKDQKGQRRDIKQAPMFRQQAKSLIQTIQLNKGISAGVKITEQLAQNKSLTKQNPLKKPSIHSLADFKQNTKQSRFKQYHPASLNKDKSYLNFSSSNNQQTSRSIKIGGYMHKNKSIGGKNRAFKSLSTYSLNEVNKDKTMELLEEYSSRGNNDSLLDGAMYEQKKKIKAKVEYRGLPFIKTKGYKAIDFTSEKSFKMIPDEMMNVENGIKNKYKSKILINDIQLLKATLQNL